MRPETLSYFYAPTVQNLLKTYISKNLHIQGIKQKESYWEELLYPGMVQPTYNVWVMLEMNKADYLKAKADVLRNLRDKFAEAGQTEAKEKAEKLLEELKEEVRRET